MNKRDIKKWLEAEHERLVKALDDKYYEDKDNFKAELITRATEGINLHEVDEMLLKVQAVLSVIKRKFKEINTDPYVSLKEWGNRSIKDIEFWNNLGTEQVLLDNVNIDYSAKITLKWRKDKDVLKQQFVTINANITNLTAKEALPYLQGLGFSIAEPTVKQEILAPVDIDFLKRIGA